MMDDLSREEVTSVIDRAVEDLLESARIEGPPVNTIKLAQEHLGMVVCLDRRQPQRGRAQRAGGARQIFLRPEPRGERHQWTVAHEIGEHFKSSLLERLGVEPGQMRAMAGESLANLFACRLLVASRSLSGPNRRKSVINGRWRTRSANISRPRCSSGSVWLPS